MNVQILDGDFLCCEFYFTYAATLLALYNSGNYILIQFFYSMWCIRILIYICGQSQTEEKVFSVSNFIKNIKSLTDFQILNFMAIGSIKTEN